MAFRLIFLSVSLSVSLVTSVYAKNSDCYSCNPDYVPGDPVSDNKTLGQIAQISLGMLKGEDSELMSKIYGHCVEFKNGGINGDRTLRKKILNKMEEKMHNGSVDAFFIEAGCVPNDIGQAYSPLCHLTAELPSDYYLHLEVIRKYFLEKNKLDLFKKFINAKNTRGHTTLDYVEFLLENKIYMKEEREQIGKYISYLCSHGGEYSIYNKKSCGTTQMANK